jgi:hypothetical protein
VPRARDSRFIRVEITLGTPHDASTFKWYTFTFDMGVGLKSFVWRLPPTSPVIINQAACHDPHKLKKPKPAKKKANGARQKQAKKLRAGHFFMLEIRDHHRRHHALAELRPGGGNEHDMHTLKRVGAKALRFGAKVGRKVMIVWDCPSLRSRPAVRIRI